MNEMFLSVSPQFFVTVIIRLILEIHKSKLFHVKELKFFNKFGSANSDNFARIQINLDETGLSRKSAGFSKIISSESLDWNISEHNKIECKRMALWNLLWRNIVIVFSETNI
jgi:hypothetical protein